MIERKRIILRADGNRETGMGHFIRSIALAEMVNRNFQVLFATVEPTAYQKEEIFRTCHGLIELQSGDHFDSFLQKIEKEDIVVLDNYFFDTSYQQKIKKTGCKLVVIDDIHDKKFAGDLILNHSPSVTPGDYLKEDYSRLLLGPRYVLLRQEFLEAAGSEPAMPDKHSVLLCFGGSDKFNLSYKYIRILHEILPELNINVILGAESEGKDLIREYIEKKDLQEKVQVYRNLSAAGLVSLINNSYIAVVPSSGIMYEILAVKRQIITGFYVDNQENIAEKIIDPQKGIFFAGNLRNPDTEFFRKALQKAFEMDYSKVFDYQASIIDGHSGKRILDEFSRLK